MLVLGAAAGMRATCGGRRDALRADEPFSHSPPSPSPSPFPPPSPLSHPSLRVSNTRPSPRRTTTRKLNARRRPHHERFPGRARCDGHQRSAGWRLNSTAAAQKTEDGGKAAGRNYTRAVCATRRESAASGNCREQVQGEATMDGQGESMVCLSRQKEEAAYGCI